MYILDYSKNEITIRSQKRRDTGSQREQIQHEKE
jgi:hypothetical protein